MLLANELVTASTFDQPTQTNFSLMDFCRICPAKAKQGHIMISY